MGSGIAQWLAARGHEVVMRDVQREFVERGLAAVRGLFDEAVRRRALSEADARSGLGRVCATTGWDGFGECDLVIEAIVEDVAAKRALFTELAGIVGPGALLASNTSALPIEEIAGHVPNPGRAVGIHFFNPVGRMPLVELILGRDTSAEAAGRALAFAKAAGKSVVVCRSSPGFLVTRVLFFYLGEAVRLWERGVPTADLDGAARGFGWPMGPMRLIDEVGIDVTDFIFGEMEHYFPGRFTRPASCAALLAAGLRGRKGGSGAGYYAYEAGAERPNDAATRGLAGRSRPAKAGPDEINSGLLGVMVAEARLCLDEGVVRSPDDIDFAMLKGAGFPPYRGGLMRYAGGAGGA
jgi:3-hydroxyacyl-CoA dehydrogenase/enoyl-CoA hydratase/3-hydroxybutyryl-CoA epimerase